MMIAVFYEKLEHPGDSWADFLVDCEQSWVQYRNIGSTYNQSVVYEVPRTANFSCIKPCFQLIDAEQASLLKSSYAKYKKVQEGWVMRLF